MMASGMQVECSGNENHERGLADGVRLVHCELGEAVSSEQRACQIIEEDGRHGLAGWGVGRRNGSLLSLGYFSLEFYFLYLCTRY